MEGALLQKRKRYQPYWGSIILKPNLGRESALFSRVWGSPTVRNLEIQNLLWARFRGISGFIPDFVPEMLNRTRGTAKQGPCQNNQVIISSSTVSVPWPALRGPLRSLQSIAPARKPALGPEIGSPRRVQKQHVDRFLSFAHVFPIFSGMPWSRGRTYSLT